MSDTAINVEHVWKQHRLGTINHRKMVQDLQSWWAQIRGKEDPNALVTVDGAKAASELTRHERFWALKDVSFDVREGELVGVIGRNGAGKSTLLKILSRVTTPTRGQITITGRVASLLEVGTGFHPDLTGRENVFLNGAILGMSKAEIRRKFDEIVAFAEIERFIDTPVKRYSSGMYVRLAFGVAAHLESEILIVDEVLAVGDAAFQMKCLGKMGEIGREGRTILFVSHNMAAVTSLCQRVVWLDRAELKMDGDVEAITKQYLQYGSENPGRVVIPEKIRTSSFFFESVTFYTSDGTVSALFNITSPIRIELEYRALGSIENLELFLRVHNSSGVTVFTTNRSASLPLGVTEGSYRCTIEIPPLFLAAGLYSIDLAAHIPSKLMICFCRGIASFKIEETGSTMSLYKGVGHGVVIKDLPWRETLLSPERG